MGSPQGGISTSRAARLKSREQDGVETRVGDVATGHAQEPPRHPLLLHSEGKARARDDSNCSIFVCFFFFNLSWFWLLFCSKKAFFKKYIKQIHFTKLSLGWSH